MRLGVTSDGEPLVVRGDTTLVPDEEAWVETDLRANDECVLASVGDHSKSLSAVAADGSCWPRGEMGEAQGYFETIRADPSAAPDDRALLVRVDTDDTRTELDLGPDEEVGFLAAGPDGTVWVMFARSGRFAGLLAYDGSGWTSIPYDGDGSLTNGAIAVDVDGAVWISWLRASQSNPSAILRWDGESWTTHPLSVRQGREPLDIRPWPNGMIWFLRDRHPMGRIRARGGRAG